MLVDTHCHLDGDGFDADRLEVLERAWQAGLQAMVVIGSQAALEMAEKDERIFATAGVHPHEAATCDNVALERVAERARHTKVIAIGEIGLDYHYDFSPRDRQRAVFRAQLDIAKEAGLPVVIHTREAWDDTFEMLERAGVQGVMHCFSGGPAEAQRSLAMGFYLSFAGILTFPKAVEIQQAAREAPDNRILVETDAPYLAPVPRRGKRNEPAFVVHTAHKLAELRGTTPEAIAELTGRNFRSAFGKRIPALLH